MTVDIEISLFDLLDEVPAILESNKEVREPEQLTLNLHKIQNKIKSFLENFFLQFFNNGFKLNLEGINEEALSKIENHFLGHESEDTPTNIINSFKDVIEVVKDIENAVYLDPPKEDDIYNAYLTFLPMLFDNFKKDEVILRDRIDNYDAIRVRMEGILFKIGNLKFLSNN